MNAGDSKPPEPELSIVHESQDSVAPDVGVEALPDNLHPLRDDVEDSAEEAVGYLAVRLVPILLGLLASAVFLRRRRRARRAAR
jgi:hypothetical protein